LLNAFLAGRSDFELRHEFAIRADLEGMHRKVLESQGRQAQRREQSNGQNQMQRSGALVHPKQSRG
jgi:hypothetical protein